MGKGSRLLSYSGCVRILHIGLSLFERGISKRKLLKPLISVDANDLLALSEYSGYLYSSWLMIRSLLVAILFGFSFSGDSDSVNSEAINKRQCEEFESLMRKIWHSYESFMAGVKLIRYPSSMLLTFGQFHLVLSE